MSQGTPDDRLPDHTESLRESEQRFRQIAENLNVGIWIYTADFGEALYVSPRAAELWGTTVQESYARPLHFLDLVHPDDMERLTQAMQNQQEAEVTVRVLRDSEVRWIRLRGFPIYNDQGEFYRAAGVTEDITERRHLEQVLRQSEAHYRRLVETSPYAIYALDVDGVFTEVNPPAEQILGRTAEDLIGRRFIDVIHSEDLPHAMKAFSDIMAEAESKVDLEIRIVQPDGEPRWLSIAVAAMRDDAGVAGAHGIARDITVERAREQHFRRSERFASMGTLISGVAHELNNPLQAIVGFAELLLTGESDEKLADEALQTISHEARRAARIVSDLKVLSRQTHDEQNRMEPIHFNELVLHTLRGRRYSIETANIEVRTDLAADLPVITGDPDRLEQALLNLVVNAEQALATVDRDRLLVVRTRPTALGIGISVYDNGPGIPPEALPHLFDPFWTTKAPGVGAGLGLSLVHSTVQEHGGRVHVESAIDQGSLFQIDLPAPRVGTPHLRTDDLPGPRVATSPQRLLRILIVDDEPGIRLLLQRVARRRGHITAAAAEGREALRLIEEAEAEGHPYDLILSDLRMPGLSGERMVGTLLSREPRYRERLVLITGDPTGSEASRLWGGDVRVLAKPVTLQQLDEVIEQAERAPRE